MVDIHTHLLFDTDDGTQNIEETIRNIQTAQSIGIDTICLTPHYIEPEYTKTKKQNIENFNKIKIELEKRKIDVKLYLGNEIYISEEINQNLNNNNISTIANSDYVLVELPRNTAVKNLEDLVEEVIFAGKKVIIAHPERYSYAQKDIKFFDKLLETGRVFLQGNYGSIIGVYGTEAQKNIIKLIKAKKLHVLASDIHRKDIYNDIPEIIKKVRKITDEKYAEQLTKDNPTKIINNENIVNEQGNNSRFFIGKFFRK